MGKEEDYIKNRYGTESPFVAPDGYFESFTDHMMEMLPEKETPIVKINTRWTRIKPLLYMAAMFITLFLPIRYLVTSTKTDNTMTQTAASIKELSDEDIYYLSLNLDEYTFYEYVTDSDSNE
ncbi:MAG: hypothetical protein WCQ82_03905 [Bacteroidaceae bacterium]|nr:hypothetical protein [Bacteroidaceae bacterium]